MKPIPFNLERCIAGDEVVTRDGGNFTFGAYNEKMAYPLIGWANGVSTARLANGKISHYETGVDLFMKPEKITRWMVVNEACGYATKDLVIDHLKKTRTADQMADLAIIKLEFCPGDGLND